MATSAGIEIGADAIKAIVLTGGAKGPIEILSAGTLPLGDLGNMPEGEDKTLALGVKLKELIKSARIKAGRRRMAVSGQGASIRYLQVPPVPPWRLDMLVNYEVQERAGGDKEASTYDYHILDAPEVNGQNTVMIGMLKETSANDFLTLARTAGAGEVELDLEATALYAAYYHGHGFDSDKTVLVCDIGADDMTVLLCKNGALLFARTMLGGGRRFTQVLADDLKIEFAEAEDLKKTQGEITFDVAPPSGAARSTLGRRVPGATNVLPRNTAMLPRPGGPLAGRADASAARPAPLRSSAIPGIGGASASQPAPAVEKPVVPAPAPVKTEDLNISLASPGSLSLDLSLMPLDEATLPPTASVPTVAKAPAPKPQPAPVAPPAPAPAVAPAPPADDLSLELDIPSLPSQDGEVKLPGPDLTLDLGTALASGPVAPSKSAPTAVPKAPERSESTALSLDLDEPINPPTQSAAAPEPAPSNTASGTPAASESPEQRKRQISAALLREAAAICAALENSVQACKAQMKLRDLKIDRIYVTGGGGQLKGLSDFIGRRMRMEVLPLEPFKQIQMNRLPVEQAAALKAEQHTLAVAVGAALSNFEQSGTFTFLLWPEALKQRKVFWARGAYLYYTAGLVAASLALFLYTPYRNAEMLKYNFEQSEKAVGEAMIKSKNQKGLEDTNEEFFFRNKQIVDNTLSGHFFLNILAELKSTRRISEDVWLTQVSTQLPNVIRAVSGANDGGGAPVPAKGKGGSIRDVNAEPDTFQAQRRIYLRGFVRGNEKGEQRILAIKDFYTRLVPHPDDPDHPDNLFKDIRPIWFSTSDHKQGAFYLTEFVLEAYTEGTARRDDVKAEKDAKENKGKAPVVPKAAPPAAPVAPIANPNNPNPNVAQPEAPKAEAEKGPAKRKKFIAPEPPPGN